MTAMTKKESGKAASSLTPVSVVQCVGSLCNPLVVITPQGGSQNFIFVDSEFLTQRELYRLGLLTTLFFLTVFLTIETGWLMLVAR